MALVRMLSRAEDPDAWSLAVAMPTSWVQFMLEDPVADAEADHAVHVEPNVWVPHDLSAS